MQVVILNIVGIILTLLGVVLYTHVKLSEAAAAPQDQLTTKPINAGPEDEVEEIIIAEDAFPELEDSVKPPKN